MGKQKKVTIKNPFEKTLSPNCPDRDAAFNRGCYDGFEKGRKTYEPIIKELYIQLREVKQALKGGR